MLIQKIAQKNNMDMKLSIHINREAQLLKPG